MMKNCLRTAAASVGAAALLAFVPLAFAADPFTVQFTVGNTTSSAGFKRAADVFGALDTAELSKFNASYTGVEAATLSIGFRGLPLVASYPVAGSAQLVFSVPSLGITESFDGVTRDQSQDLLDTYFESNGNGILDRLYREFARVSPIDPIAGNPNSLMSQMVGQDFAGGVAPGSDGKEEDGASTGLVGLGARVGAFSQGGIRSNTLVIPLSYTMRADLDPRRQVSMNLPITYIDAGGARAFSIAPGLTYRHPISDDWSLSPSVGLGLTGSADLASVGAVGSLSLASRYIFSVEAVDITIGNMVGHYRTIKVSSGEYSADPGIRSTVLKNGVAASIPVTLVEGIGSLELSYANTQFFGAELFTNNYHEFAVNVGTNRSARSARSYFRAGLSVLYTGKAKGASLNVGYWF